MLTGQHSLASQLLFRVCRCQISAWVHRPLVSGNLTTIEVGTRLQKTPPLRTATAPQSISVSVFTSVKAIRSRACALRTVLQRPCCKVRSEVMRKDGHSVGGIKIPLEFLEFPPPSSRPAAFHCWNFRFQHLDIGKWRVWIRETMPRVALR